MVMGGGEGGATGRCSRSPATVVEVRVCDCGGSALRLSPQAAAYAIRLPVFLFSWGFLPYHSLCVCARVCLCPVVVVVFFSNKPVPTDRSKLSGLCIILNGIIGVNVSGRRTHPQLLVSAPPPCPHPRNPHLPHYHPPHTGGLVFDKSCSLGLHVTLQVHSSRQWKD